MERKTVYSQNGNFHVVPGIILERCPDPTTHGCLRRTDKTSGDQISRRKHIKCLKSVKECPYVDHMTISNSLTIVQLS